jgi:heat-inducible transcriptional repressor
VLKQLNIRLAVYSVYTPLARRLNTAMSTLDLTDLNERARDVFRQLVDQYVSTGEPVGSRTLSKLAALNLSPASIRNVMQDLEEMGLLASPHTSAGRLPTDLGLRLFVDGIMQIGELGMDEKARIDAELSQKGTEQDVLAQATQMLSGLSSCAGLVVAPKQSVPIRQVDFVPLSPRRVLAILVGQDGSVENRALDLPAELPPAAMIQAANYINTRLSGLTIEQARAKLLEELRTNRTELDGLAAAVAEQGLGVWAQETTDRSIFIVRGQGKLLENSAAREDIERVRRLLDDIEAKEELVKVLDLAKAGEGMRIFIGSENKLFSLSGSSVIAAPYRNGDNKVVGVIGVIGPTRLNYARVVPMVEYTAKILGKNLGNLIT